MGISLLNGMPFCIGSKSIQEYGRPRYYLECIQVLSYCSQQHLCQDFPFVCTNNLSLLMWC